MMTNIAVPDDRFCIAREQALALPRLGGGCRAWGGQEWVDNGTIQSVERAFEVLEVMARRSADSFDWLPRERRSAR